MIRADLSDEQLMRLIATRDGTALEYLYERYSASVMGLAMKMLGNRAEADEVVQETFWRVWSKTDSYRADRGTLLSWIFGIAHNLCIDMIRQQKVKLLNIQETQIVNFANHGMNEAASIRDAVEREQVQSAMDDLPSEQREVIEMAFFKGLTRQEIAKATGVPLGTVHPRARLGLQKLRTALQARGFDQE